MYFTSKLLKQTFSASPVNATLKYKVFSLSSLRSAWGPFSTGFWTEMTQSLLLPPFLFSLSPPKFKSLSFLYFEEISKKIVVKKLLFI